ncbi:MAG TPA: ubiquinol-cytochrome c reductase iron-sulfur subunit [Tepidisphaeraceae bacterium]|nr:ubiquinol-cytochrome c reductase iron-sulfur subunit [Tepidisphaeraceae bacterium]
MRRRTLFKWLLGAAGAVMGSVVVVPAVISAFSPAGRSQSRAWRPLGPLRSFPLGDVVDAAVPPRREAYPVEVAAAQVVYVWQRTRSDFVVFSRTCTDLGCAVKYDPGSEFYYCPCHGGIFNKSGERVAGPPKKPLYRYATRVREGVLEIDLRSVPAMA